MKFVLIKSPTKKSKSPVFLNPMMIVIATMFSTEIHDLLLHESVIFQFGCHVLFQSIGAVVVFGVGSIVGPAIGQHSFNISDK